MHLHELTYREWQSAAATDPTNRLCRSRRCVTVFAPPCQRALTLPSSSWCASFSISRSCALSLTHTQTHTHSLTRSHSLSLLLSLFLFRALGCSLSLSGPSPIPLNDHTHTYTHTHAHTQARTDAFASEGLESAISRSKEYQAAGYNFFHKMPPKPLNEMTHYL
jgi:hypothetical protein